MEKRHKVVRFGTVYESGMADEDAKYRYLHQRKDLKISKGCIPVGFESYLPLDEGHNLYLETREGPPDDYGELMGPQYQISWKKDREVLAQGQGDGWHTNLDDCWTAVLAHFDHRNLLSEATLDYLDADPFVLFGIDDPVTQQALRKLQKFPCLVCMHEVPTFDEWAMYLRIDPLDPDLRWLVQSLAETELPKPWTCYKGVGSIVCYIRSDTGQVTWKHPFFDYFRQLRDFCQEAHMQGRHEEVMKVRVNRLLWTYEATRVESEASQDPLICPEYLDRMADIFGYDIKVSGCIVRNLKAQLRIFARSYRENQDVELSDIVNCAETLQRDVEKYAEMQDHWIHRVKEEARFDLTLLANGELQCVNCGTIALCFCLECKDYLCLKCYDSLHSKGARADHAPFQLVPCALCVSKPAKLHCTFTDKSLCHQCYAMDHIKQLPADGKENQPRRIDYLHQYNRYADFARERNMKRGRHGGSVVPGLDLTGMDHDYEAVLSNDWHPFYDARGVKFYHNFVTGERMRQSPRRPPNDTDAGFDEDLEVVHGEDLIDPDATSTTFSPMGNKTGDLGASLSRSPLSKTKPLPLHGFDALETLPKAREMAASQPELRNTRPPF
eukprot:CAMPEP_0206496764 /NCGR_PEP_ID=MMETSP0324_2-20121206/49669_1 /ASSEMBLY_ACC=CAM_ASM_000836 /TAXON_ID=2866 /ORGANISM="Crypthecodinium cohnii, Strain Seligo" /LENGTH=610 /DNA_ID=CAMNT_0053981975 /DNA_START=140 /DNA_END=1969 /DNA_ORIENTATION=-